MDVDQENTQKQSMSSKEIDELKKECEGLKLELGSKDKVLKSMAKRLEKV